jgi:hypothetical protein
VVSDIESFDKYTSKENIERETNCNTSETARYDTSPTDNMGTIVSPKKRLIIRSQSHTESVSPTSISAQYSSQYQKTQIDDDNPTNDQRVQLIGSHFQHAYDVPAMSMKIESNLSSETSFEAPYAISNRAELDSIQTPINKQQGLILNNKRTLSATIVG